MKTINGRISVDDEDYESLCAYTWTIQPNKHMFYAITKIEGHMIRMHRMLMGATALADRIDHKDRNGLNNQRHNLRRATNSQNCQNRSKYFGTSKYKGVYWEKNRRLWKAHIKLDGKAITIGRYYSEEQAAGAYNLTAKKLFGDFAVLNKI